ncbi:hypothetical protein GCM10028806_41810 [Spirosoma terrae]|uniref:Uncharacterized protein n=1 Tax=Spirosoma terrae TaxID=1968276 RepID=A0A6L9L5P4_9BACT|nr:hypothetical protein [Spirosoma terrae]NDU94153.1 hypothetical protein [Spirosoma terrae]
MEPSQRFRVLYYLDNESASIVEIKRLDIDPDSPVYKLYYWLFWNKDNNNPEQLRFVSMTSLADSEKRVFEHGALSFNEQEGLLTMLPSHPYALQRRSPLALSAADVKLIDDFLDSIPIHQLDKSR